MWWRRAVLVVAGLLAVSLGAALTQYPTIVEVDRGPSVKVFPAVAGDGGGPSFEVSPAVAGDGGDPFRIVVTIDTEVGQVEVRDEETGATVGPRPGPSVGERIEVFVPWAFSDGPRFEGTGTVALVGPGGEEVARSDISAPRLGVPAMVAELDEVGRYELRYESSTGFVWRDLDSDETFDASALGIESSTRGAPRQPADDAVGLVVAGAWLVCGLLLIADAVPRRPWLGDRAAGIGLVAAGAAVPLATVSCGFEWSYIALGGGLEWYVVDRGPLTLAGVLLVGWAAIVVGAGWLGWERARRRGAPGCSSTLGSLALLAGGLLALASLAPLPYGGGQPCDQQGDYMVVAVALLAVKAAVVLLAVGAYAAGASLRYRPVPPGPPPPVPSGPVPQPGDDPD